MSGGLTTITGFLGFADVLGFKDLVEHNALEKVLKVYNNALIAPASLAASGGAVKIIEEADTKRAIADPKKMKVQVLVISDSVVVWTSTLSMHSFIEITTCFAHLLGGGIATGVPLRAFLTMGEVGLLRGNVGGSSGFAIHSLVGIPIVRAFTEEKAFQWSGCVLDHECINLYKTWCDKAPDTEELATLEHLETTVLAQYEAPHKQLAERTRRWVVCVRYSTSLAILRRRGLLIAHAALPVRSCEERLH